MKKLLISLLGIAMSIGFVHAQNNMMYLMKPGNVVYKWAVTEIDCVLLHKPAHIDLFPTLLELTDIPMPKTLAQGGCTSIVTRARSIPGNQAMELKEVHVRRIAGTPLVEARVSEEANVPDRIGIGDGAATEIPSFSWQQTGASLALLNHGRIVWQFNHLQDGSERGVPYFHPLATLDGAVLTDLRPDDHLWHRGLRFAWKQINGQDGYWTWPEGLERFPEATGQTEVTAVRMAKGKDFSARFELELSYHPPGQPDDLTEKRTILVSAPDAKGRYRIDWQGVFTAGVRGAVLDRTPIPGQPEGKPWGGYAGLQLRLPQRENLAAWGLLNSQKLAATSSPDTVDKGSARGLQELHGQSARWMEASVEFVDGRKAAVTLFDHPGNLRHPAAWHVSSMPNELIQTPLFHGPYTLAASESLTFNYRILVSSERCEAGFLDQEWEDFAGKTSVPFIETEEKSDWTSLFDGKTLAGWKASENPKSFTVRDGMIVARATGDFIKEQAPHAKSHLFYIGADGEAAFTDFEFQAEVKVDPGANGGIYFHTEFVEKNWPQKGFEVQINNTYKDPRKTGSLYAVADVAEPVAKDDEWFTVWFRVEGKHVQIKINGELVVDWTEPEGFVSRKPPWWSERRLSHGTFALQAHDEKSVVYFRNLKVKPLNERLPGESWVNPPREAIPGVEHRTLRSASMQHDVGFNLYLPPGYADSEQRFPVVYYLHGMTDCESTHPQLFAILDQAIRAGEVPPMILVYSMCGRTSFYADSPDGEVMGETVFIKELIPHMDSTVRTIASRDARAVMGFSMGGAGAVKFACKYPDLFGSAVSFSGGFTTGAFEKPRHPELFKKMFGDDVQRFDDQSAIVLARAGGCKVPLRLVVGTEDFLLAHNRQIKAVLEERQADFEYEEIEGVAHNPPLVFAAQGLKAFAYVARYFRP